MATRFDNDTILAYIDRRLDAATEEDFELALLADPDLAEQVQAEVALRRGFTELRRTGAANDAVVQPAIAHATPAPMPDYRRGRRLGAVALAAALALAAIVPTVLLVQQRDHNAALEERLVARLEASGSQATYALPAAVFTPATATAPDAASEDGPVRIRLPDGVSEVALEIPAANLDVPRRLVLQRADQPGARLDVDGLPLADAGAFEFQVGSERLAPGRYLVTVEALRDGAWATERRMVLAVDAR